MLWTIATIKHPLKNINKPDPIKSVVDYRKTNKETKQKQSNASPLKNIHKPDPVNFVVDYSNINNNNNKKHQTRTYTNQAQ